MTIFFSDGHQLPTRTRILRTSLNQTTLDSICNDDNDMVVSAELDCHRKGLIGNLGKLSNYESFASLRKMTKGFFLSLWTGHLSKDLWLFKST